MDDPHVVAIGHCLFFAGVHGACVMGLVSVFGKRATTGRSRMNSKMSFCDAQKFLKNKNQPNF